ncbi:MAG: 1-aminocyclopropane-1-carboxylate deaminase/D-cysteine desulfhydrase [Ignavibacteriaceae bacterium]
MIEKIARLHLANLPTPLEPAFKLASHLGLKSLLIKRDDLTGLAMGGNKARKLEFELAGVLSSGYDTVITVGGQQSNHARMTAAACRKIGLDIKLVLGGEDFSEFKGNLLLDTMFGADIRFIIQSDEDEDLSALQMSWKEELTAEGKKPYAMPIGGSTPLGTLGYTEAMEELRGQIGNEEVQILLPVGSCGTLAGVVLGCGLYLPGARVIGISVSRTKENIFFRTRNLIKETSKLIGADEKLSDTEFEVFDNYHEAYAVHVKPAIEAAAVCARLEGLLVDQVYTGKAMAGLFDLALRGELKKETPVIFLHTGGQPEIFADTLKFGEYPKCVKFTIDQVRKGVDP